jgi:hypothetical protein
MAEAVMTTFYLTIPPRTREEAQALLDKYVDEKRPAVCRAIIESYEGQKEKPDWLNELCPVENVNDEDKTSDKDNTGYALALAMKLSLAFENDSSLVGTDTARFAFANLAVLDNRISVYDPEIYALDGHQRRAYRQLTAKAHSLVSKIPISGIKVRTLPENPLTPLHDSVRDKTLPAELYDQAVEILSDGYDLLGSMLLCNKIGPELIKYFISNAEAIRIEKEVV